VGAATSCTGLLLGLRPGEVLGLQWDDIDQAAGRLTVKRAIRRPVGDCFVLGDQDESSTRTRQAYPRGICPSASSSPPNGGANGRRSGVEGDGSCVHHGLGRDDQPIDQPRAFSRLTKSASLGHWRPHELRHSMVSILSHRGVPLEQITDLAGHSPGSRVTATVYRHRIGPSVDAARDSIDALFGPPSPRSEAS